MLMQQPQLTTSSGHRRRQRSSLCARHRLPAPILRCSRTAPLVGWWLGLRLKRQLGSSSLRTVLEQRAKQSGLDDARHRVPEQVEWARICQSGSCVTKTALKSGKEPLCAAMPDNAVVQTVYGFCQILTSTTGRPCDYITVLREPVARMVSSHQYNCKACAEKGRWCPRRHQPKTQLRLAEANARLPRDRDGLLQLQGDSAKLHNTCPGMSLLDFAAMVGNVYVDTFGHDGLSPTYSARGDAGIDWFLAGEVTAAELSVATAALRRKDMLVLLTDEIRQGEGGMAALNDYLDDTPWDLPDWVWAKHNVNANPQAQANADRALVGRILRFDVALYAEALRLAACRRRGLGQSGQTAGGGVVNQHEKLREVTAKHQ